MAQTQELTLSTPDWERIQSLLNQPKPKVYNRQEVIDRNAQLQFSRAKLKLNKALLGKLHLETKRRRQAQEDYLNKIAAEEAEMKKQERQNMIDRAKYVALQQDDRVRQFNRMLQMISVQEETEALIRLKQEKQKVVEEQKRQYEEETRYVQEEAVKQKQEKAHLKKLSNQTLAAYWVEQMREKQQLREKQMQQEKEEGDQIRCLAELNVQEELRNQELQAQSKKKYFSNIQENIFCRKLERKMEAQKLDIEEEKRKQAQFDLEYKIQQRQRLQAEKSRHHQLLIENVRDKLAVRLKEQAATITRKEEESLAQTLAKWDALQAKKEKEEKENRAAMVKSIASHKERAIQEKTLKEQADRKSKIDWLEAQNEADRLFHQKQSQKAQRAREARIKCREDNDILTAEKLKRDKHEAVERRTEQPAGWMEEEIQQYIERELTEAAQSQRKVSIHLPARTGGHGFLVGGKQLDCSLTKPAMPTLVADQARFIKQCLDHEALQPSTV
ncbi:hypothetical protein EXN66_Car015206 [Channa argus]|uniref:Trichohyalin-plectin-homology domain-containing protein n=1 Tax=Channa argus TaxID=215402 RepID=A0A6G1QAT2_CHAAH|nr:hypothetical protein EXN66_Car015206 [Channa argus]